VTYKLVIGLGIAGLVAAYQEKPAHVEGRGANIVSSQTADLIQVGRLIGHKGAVTAVAVADQGRWIVSSGNDSTVRIWNAASGALIRTIELDDGSATAMAVDERRALTAHKSGMIVLWDLERAEKLAQFQSQDGPVTALAFMPEPNNFAATGQAGPAALFDVRIPPAPVWTLDGHEGSGPLISAAASRGLLATAGYDRIVRLWRTDTRALGRSYRSFEGAVSAMQIAPGGRILAAASEDGLIRFWSTSSSRTLRSFKAHQGRVTALAFAPNDRVFASAGDDGLVKLWDARSSRPIRVLRGHAGAVRAVSFSPDGRRVFSAGDDGTVRIWTAALTAVTQ
jgi:WD40 repeat protein